MDDEYAILEMSGRTSMTRRERFCGNCGRMMEIDYGFDGEDEYGYYLCPGGDYTDDLGYGGGSPYVERVFLRDKNWNILEGPTQDEYHYYRRED